ncbi:MAG: efflux RND transporter permease subunit [Fibrobacteraceae bacterium]
MIKASIYKPITMLMIILTVVVFGIYTYQMMPVNMLPDFEVPVVTAVVQYKGATPEELESTVIKPVEDQVELIDGLDYVKAYGMEHYAIFVIVFEMGTDIDVAANDVRDKISQAEANFPDAVEAPIISKVDINSSAILSYAFTGPGNSTELRKKADDEIKPLLTSTPGVASVDLFGGTTRQIVVELHKDKLLARKVSATTVMAILQAANINYPVGDLHGVRKNTGSRTKGKFQTLDEIRKMEIPTGTGVIRLSEIADVKDTVEDRTSASRYNGINSVGLDIKKRTDASVVAVAKAVNKKVEQINKDLPEGYKLNLVYDKSSAVQESLDNVITNIKIAVILTAIILLLFLGKFSSMFIAAVTMPISVVGAFTFMYFAGFTINIMSLMALSSAVGLLVTNSIIVLENISDKINAGLEPKEAAYKGTSEIMVAIMASTLTNVCVFVPIAFMKSIAGSMFRTYGMTMVFATAVSLLITFTLTPLMAAYMFKARKKNADGTFVEEKKTLLSKALSFFPKVMDKFRNFYIKTLSFALSIPGVLIQFLALVGIIFITFFLVKNFMTVELMSESDEGVIKISLELPSGTNIETADSIAKVIESRFKDIPELKRYYTTVGGESGITSVGQATFKLTLKNRKEEGRVRSTDAIIDSLRTVLSDIPDAYISIKSSSTTEMGNGNQGDVVLEVSSLDGDDAIKAADIAKEKVKEIPGVTEVKSSYEAGKPEIAFIPNRAAIADYGMTVQEAATASYIYVSGYEASTYTEDGEEYDLYLRLRESDRKTRTEMLDLPILTPKGYVPMTALFNVQNTQAPTQITRKHKKRLVEVSMNLTPGHTTGEIMGKIKEAYPKWEGVPEGVSFSFGGTANMQDDMVNEFVTAIIMAILLTYILLVALLESFAQPFVILTTIPMGAIGVILSLVVTGRPLSMIAFMAIVMLIGVVVNNAILLLDAANQNLRKGDMGRRSAIITAGKDKFQAIMLATFASIVAQLPLAFGVGGDMAAATQPMGIASVGGLIISGILTMYLVPTFFWLPNAIFHKTKKQASALKVKLQKSAE